MRVEPIAYEDTAKVPDVLKMQYYPPLPRLEPTNKWLPMLTPSQLVEIHTAFKRFDKDGDGHIEPKEIQKIMSNVGVDLPPHEIQKLIASVDEDGSGTVEFDAFVGILASNMIGQDGATEIEKAFSLFDPYDTGFIDMEHARQLLCHSGARPLTSEEVDTMFASTQPDASGRITMKAMRELKCWEGPPEHKKMLNAVVEDVQQGNSSSGAAAARIQSPAEAEAPPPAQ